MKGTKNPINLIITSKYRRKNKKDTFANYGLYAFMGKFGSGKTLACVNTCFDILSKNEKTIFITNTEIKGLKNKTYLFNSAKDLVDTMQKVIRSENKNGYVILIDEIHVVLSDLFAHSDPIFLTYLSQLRKLGIMIIGTCQLYNKCPKMVRDYLRLNGQICYCGKVLGGLTFIRYVDMETCNENSRLELDYKLKKIEWFFHTTELYESYDTFAVISQIKGLMKYEEERRVLINGDNAN